MQPAEPGEASVVEPDPTPDCQPTTSDQATGIESLESFEPASGSEPDEEVESEEEEDGTEGGEDLPARADHVDFLKDFGSSELFLVDGDSLVLYACGDQLLDWTFGGQHLHLVFVVEQFLANLKQRGGIFEIFFMQGNDSVFDSMGSAVRLAREVVACHLVKLFAMDKGPRVNIVAGGWRSQAAAVVGENDELVYGVRIVSWRALLGSLMPAFIMTDYHQPSVHSVGLQAEHLNTAPANEPASIFVKSCIGSSTYVILLTGIEFRGSRIYAFLLSPRVGMNTQSEQSSGSSKEQLSSVSAGAPQESSDPTNSCRLPKDAADDMDLCSRIRVQALGAVLGEGSGGAADTVFAAVMCVVGALQRELPLRKRSFDLRGVGFERLNAVHGLREFVDKVQNAMVSCMPRCAARESAPTSCESGVADLYDGRLLFVTLLCVAANNEEGLWDSALMTAAGEMWGCVSPQGPSLEHCLARAADVVADARATLEEALDAKQSRSESPLSWGGLAPLDAAREDSLLSQVLGDVQAKMAEYEDPSLSLDFSMGLFGKDHHFHNIRPLEEDMCDKEPDFLSFAVLGSSQAAKSGDTLQLTGRQAWYQLKRQNRMKQKQAFAATRFEDSLLYGSGVRTQTITCSPEEMEKERLWRKQLKDSSMERLRLLETEEQQGRDCLKGMEQSDTDALGVAEASRKKHGAKPKKQAGKMSKAEEIKLQNQARMDEDMARISLEKMRSIHNTNKTESFEIYEKKILDLCMKPAECTPEAAAYGRLRIVEKVCTGKDAKQSKDLMLKRVFVHLQGILRRKKGVSRDVLTEVRQWAEFAGFNDLAQQIERDLASDMVTTTKAKTKPSSKSSSKKTASKVGSTSAITFQLQGAPEHLKRPEGVGGDPRVEKLGFSPDKWQQKLLDIIDSDNSALVIAPTAAGKTFISYYIMERCLRQGHDGIVVFVAPTKALVNQVKAEICARYSKTCPGGRALAGVFTRDYRENETNCQILVTVPQCLEILLLSPANVGWSQRIQHVILDEVHNIGEEQGECWERVILLCKAPILGLSATLGDVNRFVAWLKSVEEAKGRKLFTVNHSERWNDLATWVYDPADKGKGSIEALHPCTAVLRGHEKRLIPEDLRLLPEHCVELYTAMQGMLSGEEQARLDPETYFRNASESAESVFWDLSMRDVARWEAELKRAFNALAASDDQDRVLDAVCGKTREIFMRSDLCLEAFSYDTIFLLTHCIGLIRELQRKSMMPAICFHMSRKGCERMAIHASQYLRKKQQEKQERDGWKEKCEKLKQKIQTLLSAREKLARNKTSDDIEEQMMQIESEIQELQAKYDSMSGVNREFTFFPEGFQHLTEAELDYVLPDVPEEYEWLRRAMLRGIAVHHSGLNKKVRQAVERLFRKKLLVVVFATGTLAMGINMPCRTSVFAGDAVYINAMSYRQMAGRAGRRGFDLRGNVVFCGMKSSKINRLMRSKLPVLQGNQILSASTVLRLIMMHAGTVNKIDSTAVSEVVRSIVRMVRLPHHNLGLGHFQSAHTFRYCLEFLCREGMLAMIQPQENDWLEDERSDENSNGDGRGRIVATDLAGLISHIHYVEPANFAFYALLMSESRVLHKVCRKVDGKNSEEELLSVLCHLFNRMPLAPHFAKQLKQRPAVGPSKVLLPKLRHDVQSALDLYNHRALTAVIEYQMCFAKAFEAELGTDNVLPLSGLKHAVPEREDLLLPSALADLFQPVTLRSAYVALSGNFDDDFQSISELCFSMRRGLHLDQEMVPAFEPPGDNELNAYVLDFFKHGQIRAITRDNKVSKDDAWFLLYDMSLIIKALAAAMRFRYDNRRQCSSVFGDFAVVRTLERVSDRFGAMLRSVAS